MAGGGAEAAWLPLGGVCDRACVNFFGGSVGGFTFLGFENVREGNGDAMAFTVLETFLEGRGEGGFTQLAFIECDSRGDGSGIA